MKYLVYDQFLWWREKSESLARDWEVFKKNLFLHFLDTKEKGFVYKLTPLQQFGTMEEFFRDLHVLATRVPNISEDWLLQTTLSGLKENI
jgi:hypothetical protein